MSVDLIVDLQVGDVTLFDVEVTLHEGGVFEYHVPDCIGYSVNGSKIQQVTIDQGICRAVLKTDVQEAMKKHVETLL